MKKILRSAAGVLMLAAATATLTARDDVELRVGRVENGLVPPVVLAGRPVKTARLRDRMRELKIPAVSVAVFDRGAIQWLRAWGLADVSAKRPATPRTRFQAASISKPVAAATALALVSRGRLSLDSDINAYLKSWKLPDNEFTADRKVTLADLLTHSAGVTVSGFRGYAKGEKMPTLLQLLDGVEPANSAPIRVDVPIGSRWRYAGGGYQIVQLAIEDVTGQPFAEVARELVLEPFGLRNSTFAQPLPSGLRVQAAKGYRDDGKPVDGGWHTYPEQAAAGLWTTAEDLARFALALQEVAAGQSDRVMSRELAGRMLRRQFEQFGLGVAVTGDGAEARFSHSGGNEGFRCYLVSYREAGSGVAIMTNSDAGGAIVQEIARAVAREYGWPGIGPVTRTLGTADPRLYGDFAGLYELPMRSPPVILRIEVEAGRLVGGRTPSRSELFPENASTFFAMDSDLRIEFVRDESGKVSGARVWQGEAEQLVTKVQ
jgi:CubicO group peptidase (beta-lactamase class C family)